MLFTTSNPHVSTLSVLCDLRLYLSLCIIGSSFSSACAVGASPHGMELADIHLVMGLLTISQ
jgi:hypothetical protein